MLRFWFILFGAVLWTQALADRIVLVAGGSQDGSNLPASEARLREPFAAEFNSKGSLFILEMAAGNRLLQIDAQGRLIHLAGQIEAGDSGDDGPGLSARFNGPHNIAVLPDNRILVADTWNGRLRQFDPASGRVTSVKGYAVPAAQGRSNGPYCVTADGDGSQLYIANLRQVLRLDLKDHSLKVLAGNGQRGVPPDGALATEAPLVDPRAVAPDRLGNVYVLERGGNALRVVDRNGRIRTVVNVAGTRGVSPEQGPAADAGMNGPKHLCIDRDNNVIIADAENNLVLKYLPATREIRRVAGTGRLGSSGLGGDPLRCELARPHGVSIHPLTGELFITDSYNNRILRLTR